MALTDIENKNFLDSNKFKLVLRRTPAVEYFCTKAEIPSVSVDAIPMRTPVNTFYVSSTNLNYEPLNVTFKVDEDLKNYVEIYNWMVGIGTPRSLDQFANITIGDKKRYSALESDGSLVTLSNVHNFNVEFVFKDLKPTSLSGLDFNIDDAGNVLQATASFSFTTYEINLRPTQT